MANALEKAPTKTEKNEVEINGEKVVEGSNEHIMMLMEFDSLKKYMFEAADETPERELPVVMTQGQKSIYLPHKKHKPFQNIVMTSQIVWNNKRRMIRYYDGCDTIFADKQPKEKEVIDQYIKQSRKRNFLDGKFGCFGEDYWLLFYLNICSWNVESPFRTRTANGIFKSMNPDKVATSEAAKLDLIEQAMKLAKEASETKMRIHADYLGVPTEDWDSGNELSADAVRTLYRQEASRNPQNFVDSYGNKALEVKYFINKGWMSGLINNKLNPNKATWGSKDSVICDISGLKSSDAITQRIFEFSQTEEGQEFAIQLRSINEK